MSVTMDLQMAIYNKMLSDEGSEPFVQFLFSDEFVEKLKLAAEEASVAFRVTSQAAIEEFRRFIALQVFVQDVNHTKISPSRLMDSLWRAAVLDTRFYAKLQALAGTMLHHHLQGANEAESEQRAQRIITMENLYDSFFDRNHFNPTDTSSRPTPSQTSGDTDYDPTVNCAWNDFGKAANGWKSHARATINDDVRQDDRDVPKVLTDIHVKVREWTGETYLAWIRSVARISELKKQIQFMTGILPDQQCLVYKGELMEDDKRLADYSVSSESTIHLALQKRGPQTKP